MPNKMLTRAEVVAEICDAAEKNAANENDALIIARATARSMLGDVAADLVADEMLRRRSARRDA